MIYSYFWYSWLFHKVLKKTIKLYSLREYAELIKIHEYHEKILMNFFMKFSWYSSILISSAYSHREYNFIVFSKTSWKKVMNIKNTNKSWILHELFHDIHEFCKKKQSQTHNFNISISFFFKQKQIITTPTQILTIFTRNSVVVMSPAEAATRTSCVTHAHNIMKMFDREWDEPGVRKNGKGPTVESEWLFCVEVTINVSLFLNKFVFLSFNISFMRSQRKQFVFNAR